MRDTHARSGLRCALAKSNATPSSGLLNLFMSGQSSAAHHCRAAPYVLSGGLDLRGGDGPPLLRRQLRFQRARRWRRSPCSGPSSISSPCGRSPIMCREIRMTSDRPDPVHSAACGRLPVSNIANFSASTRSSNRPPRRPLWSWTTQWERWGRSPDCTLCLNCTKAAQGLQLDREGVSAVPKMEASCSLDKDQARADAWIEA